MLPDPQSIDFSGISMSLPRISSGVNAGKFAYGDGNLDLSISHTYAKRVRRLVRLDYRGITGDPLLTGVYKPIAMSAYMVIDTPIYGFNNDQQRDAVVSLVGFLTDDSNANLLRIIGGES
jgi:hypothetical protein